MNADPINAEGLHLIMRNEGCCTHAYRDIVGVPTIGWGHTGLEVHDGLVWTQEQCDTQLEADLDKYERGVDAAIGDVETTDNQFAAMVSLAYNIGIGGEDKPRGFWNSSVARAHRAGDYEAAAAAFADYCHAGGRVVEPLARRRAEERALYLKPDDPAAKADEPPGRAGLIAWFKKELGL